MESYLFKSNVWNSNFQAAEVAPECKCINSLVVVLFSKLVIALLLILGLFKIIYTNPNGFGGLGVACWPLVPKFTGSNPAEAVGFLGR